MWDIEKVSSGVMRELGEPGLQRMHGQVFEDYIPKLRNLRKRMEVYEEMVGDPTIGAILFAIELHIRRVKFRVKAADDTPRARKSAEFLEDCMEDMSHTWEDFITEVLTMIPFGFSIHETVYKTREDGRVGWKKLPIRAQSSVVEWDFDENGGLRGFWQRTWNQRENVYIPIERCILFRPASTKGNPEGRSALRTAYTSYYFKKKLEVIEAIGIERDLTGYPVVKAPIDIFGDSKVAKEMRGYANDLVTRIRRDEQSGAVLPPGWELELIASPGRTNIDTGDVISRYDVRIAQSMLSDIIMLGHVRTGSYALADTKYELLMSALEAWVQAILSTLNRYAVPKLMELNGWTAKEKWPKIVSGPVQQIDPLKLANTLYRLVGIDTIKPDSVLEEYLRDFLGLPAFDPEERAAQEEEERAREGEERSRQEMRIGERKDNINRPTSADGAYNQELDS